jgi:hypothetical protein
MPLPQLTLSTRDKVSLSSPAWQHQLGGGLGIPFYRLPNPFVQVLEARLSII